jgi:hypothetical protein
MIRMMRMRTMVGPAVAMLRAAIARRLAQVLLRARRLQVVLRVVHMIVLMTTFRFSELSCDAKRRLKGAVFCGRGF